MDKKSLYQRSDPLFESRHRGLTLPEVLFDIMLAVNLAMQCFYSVYFALNAQMTSLFLLFSIVLLLCRVSIELTVSQIAALGICFFISALVIFVNHSGIGVLVYLIWPLSVVYLFTDTPLSEHYYQRISVIMLLAWLVSVYNSYTVNTYFYSLEHGNRPGILNPNTMALMLSLTAVFVSAELDRFEYAIPLKLLLYVVSFFAIYRTSSRTSLISFSLMVLIDLFLRRRIMRSRRAAFTAMALVIALALIFPIVYVSLYNQGILTNEAEFLDKATYSGRQYIWASFWNYMKANPTSFIWGTGYNTSFYALSGFNLHNTYLQLLAQYGLPMLIIYMGYLFHSVSRMYGPDGTLTPLQFKCFQVILLVMCIGITEAILTNIPTLIFHAMALGIGTRERKERITHDPQDDPLLLVRGKFEK